MSEEEAMVGVIRASSGYGRSKERQMHTTQLREQTDLLGRALLHDMAEAESTRGAAARGGLWFGNRLTMRR